MGLLFEVVNHKHTNDTLNHDIALSRFGGETPQGVAAFYSAQASAGTANNATFGFGASSTLDWTTNHNISISSKDALSTTNCRREIYNEFGRVKLGDDWSWRLQSLSADNVEIDQQTANANLLYSHIMAFGGTGVVYNVVSHAILNGSGDTSQTVAHGLGATPDAVICLNVNTASSGVRAQGSIGFWDGTDQQAIGFFDNHNRSVTSISSTVHRNGQIAHLANYTGTATERASISSADSTNITLSVNDPAGWASGSLLTMICISGVEAKTGTFDPGTGTGTKNLAVTGIDPKAFIAIPFNNLQAAIDDVSAGLYAGLWASDGTEHASISFASDDAVATSNCGRSMSLSRLDQHNASGVQLCGVSDVTFSSEQVALDYDYLPSDINGGFPYLVLGDVPTANNLSPAALLMG